MNATATIAENIEPTRAGAHRADGERTQRRESPELGKLLADIEAMLQRTALASDFEIDKLRAQVAGRLSSQRETLAERGRRARDTAWQAARATNTYVRESPWQSVGVAAALGAAVGFLLGRR
jgi:ElaB/YqjD/DUF883 family membrane-anchored ribosome-binding protein